MLSMWNGIVWYIKRLIGIQESSAFLIHSHMSMIWCMQNSANVITPDSLDSANVKYADTKSLNTQRSDRNISSFTATEKDWLILRWHMQPIWRSMFIKSAFLRSIMWQGNELIFDTDLLISISQNKTFDIAYISAVWQPSCIPRRALSSETRVPYVNIWQLVWRFFVDARKPFDLNVTQLQGFDQS